MAKFSGRLVDLGIGKEAVAGTGIAPDLWLPWTELSVADKVVDARRGPSLGRLADSEQRHVLTKYAEGNVGAAVRSQTVGYLLYSLLGTLSTTGPTDEAYTHAFSINNASSGTTLALTVVDKNEANMYRRAVVRSLELEVPLDDVALLTADFVARTAATSSGTASYSTDTKFPKNDTKVKFAAAVGDLAAASAISPKRVRLTMAREIIMDDVLGTSEPEDYLAANISIEGEVELNYEDQTYRDFFKGGSYRAMEIKLQNTGVTIGSGSTNPSLTIQLPRVDFFEWEPNYPLDDISSQRFSFKASYDVANSLEPISTCSLVNGKTSY